MFYNNSTAIDPLINTDTWDNEGGHVVGEGE